MKLVSLNAMNEEDRSDFAELLNFPGSKLRRIYAISAYYDHKSIKQLIKYMDNHGASGKKSANLELIIVLDRGVRVDKCLKNLDKKIRKKFRHRKSGIYLAYHGSLFHSKGYLVESKADGLCAVGSLNLTQRGLEKNEELLARSEYRIKPQSCDSKFAEDFKKYLLEDILKHDRTRRVRDLNENSLPIDSPPIDSNIQEFFLAGKLYYEAIENNPFGFKLDLPEELKIRPAINTLLDSKTSDILDVKKLLPEKKVPFKSNWKRYCLQTCYGYWAPGEDDFPDHYEALRLERDKKIKIGSEYYKIIFNRLEKEESYGEEIFKKLQVVCEDIIEYMKSNSNNIKDQWKFLKDGHLAKEMLRGKLEDLFYNLKKKNNPEFIHRLCRDVKEVRMPDMREDPFAFKDFGESFKESFDYEWNKYESNRRGSTNQLFKLLIDPDASNGLSWEAVRQWLELEQGDS